ncbi:hypothetical protein [Saccharopolyspora tripterygii]
MATLTPIGSMRGPTGPAGPSGTDGRGVSSAGVNPSGDLILTYSDSTQANAGHVVGADGTSVTIQDNVPTAADLPSGLTEADAGKGWITDDTGHLHVWSGSEFTDAGAIKGPPGDTGPAGPAGPRGSSFFTSAGAPDPNDPRFQAGDTVMDTATGTLYSVS